MGQMEETTKSSGSYRIEVSGWGLDSSFFVEKTDLFWEQSGGKRASLHHTVAEGAVVFVRLLWPESGNTTPVPYRVSAVEPMDCNGACEIQLDQLRPRTKVPKPDKHASDLIEDASNGRELNESLTQLEPEEILQ
jgi:hypothetical protein